MAGRPTDRPTDRLASHHQAKQASKHHPLGLVVPCSASFFSFPPKAAPTNARQSLPLPPTPACGLCGPAGVHCVTAARRYDITSPAVWRCGDTYTYLQRKCLLFSRTQSLPHSASCSFIQTALMLCMPHIRIHTYIHTTTHAPSRRRRRRRHTTSSTSKRLPSPLQRQRAKQTKTNQNPPAPPPRSCVGPPVRPPVLPVHVPPVHTFIHSPLSMTNTLSACLSAYMSAYPHIPVAVVVAGPPRAPRGSF